MKIGDIVRLNRDLAPSLIGVKCEVIRISGLHTLTVRILEEPNGSSCWKVGDQMHVMPYNVKEDR